MTRPKAPRGQIVPRLQKDGRWRTKVPLGIDPATGKEKRPDVYGRSLAECLAKAEALQRRASLHGLDHIHGGTSPTLEAWVSTWLGRMQESGEVKPSTWAMYESLCRKHIVPALGSRRLDKLSTDDVRALLYGPRTKPISDAMRKHIHRVLRACLAEARRQGLVQSNAASLVKVKTAIEPTIEPFTIDEVRTILASSSQPARWALALVVGMRQGEVLGLRWSDIDLDDNIIRVRHQLPRTLYRHGCPDPSVCTDHAIDCPARRANDILADTKTRAGRRDIPIDPAITTLLRTHKARQNEQRINLGAAWNNLDLVFCTGDGLPLNHRNDYRTWKNLLIKLNIPHRRLHDARHTAATLLLFTDTHPMVTKDMMGWSSQSMAERYQHPLDGMRRDAARAVGNEVFGT